MQLIYRIDIFEDNYNIVRDRFETESVNVMKSTSLVAKTQRKSQYILAASVYQKTKKIIARSNNTQNVDVIQLKFCDIILYSSVNVSKFLFIILCVKKGTERI